MRLLAPAPRGAVTGPRIWLGALVIAVGVRAGLGTIGALLAPGPWLTAATVAVVLVLAAAALTRAFGPPEWAPVAALGTALLVVAVGYGGEGSTPALPGTETLGRLADLVRAGTATVNEGRIPVLADRGLELIVVAAVALAAVIIDALALSLRMAGLAGVALAGLWVPTLVFERPPSTVSLLVGASAWLLLLWLTRPTRGPDAGIWSETPLAVTVTLAVALIAIVVGPLAAALPGYGTMRLPATWGPGIGGGQGLLSLSDSLDLRADLGSQPGQVVLTYTSDLPDVGPLRTQTLMDFDGQMWHPVPAGDHEPATGVLWPEPTTAAPTGSLDVSVRDLDQDYLPIPLDPRAVSLDGSWQYDPVRDEVVGGTTRGLAFHVDVAQRDLTADTLRADHAALIPEGSPELQVPDTPFSSRIADLAREITDGVSGTYDQAIALQSYFRGADFRYATQIPPAQTNDPLWDFLNDRAGYCVQYATAMAIMARDLGIPSRVGIGFLPGERSADGTVSVTGDRAHAWPELWFAGAGWVRFEPTPAVQTGAPPTYANPAVPVSPQEPDNLIPTAGTQTPSGTATPEDGTTNAGAGGVPASSHLPWFVLAGVVLVAGAGGLVLARRRTGHGPAWGPEEAWLRLRRDATRTGVTWSDAGTPRQVAARLHAAVPAHDQQAHAAIDRLSAAVESYRYAPHPQPVDSRDLVGWVKQVSGALSAARRDGVPSAPRSG